MSVRRARDSSTKMFALEERARQRASNDTSLAAALLMARRESLGDFFTEDRKIGSREFLWLAAPSARNAAIRSTAAARTQRLAFARAFDLPIFCEISSRRDLPRSATTASAIRAAFRQPAMNRQRAAASQP